MRITWTAALAAVLAAWGTGGVVCAQEIATAATTVPANAMSVIENQWVKLGDCPPDPLGRELQPGRGAYWAFDPVGKRFLRYGGYTPTDANDLWTYDLAERQWANPMKVDYSWPPPGDRPGAGAWWSPAYDGKRKVVWLHGGSGVAARYHGELFQDIWQLDPATGTFKAAGSKNWPRYGAPIVYDAKNDLVVRAPAYDGEWASRHNKGRTWVYDPNTNQWQGKSNKSRPGYAGQVGFVYEPNLGVSVYLGHEKKGGPIVPWTYDAATNEWTKLEIPGDAPEGRVYPAAAYDPHNKVVLLYGGVGQPDNGYGYMHRGGGEILDDTWVLDVAGKTWTKLNVGAPHRPRLPGENPKETRFTLRIAADYDSANKAFVVSAPTFGVWALRHRAEDSEKLPQLKVGPLAKFDPPVEPEGPIFKMADPNPKLVNLEPGKWIKLDGGGALGGGEVPVAYDEATGYLLKYGGCNDGGTTFASGYGNDLCAFDPATERWIALRWTDPCGPPRPANGCTRYYSYDPVRKVTWFFGGTSGNSLASTTLANGGGPGEWVYNGLRDRFELRKSANRVNYGTGTVSVYDRANDKIIINPKEAWRGGNVCTFDPSTGKWAQTKEQSKARVYTYPCYVGSLKAMMVIDPGQAARGKKKAEAAATWIFDAAKGEWRDLKPGGDPLPPGGRPELAWDPDNDIVLCDRDDSTWLYDVKANTWSKLAVEGKPRIGESLIFDTRHKVFLGYSRGSDVWAFRYK